VYYQRRPRDPFGLSRGVRVHSFASVEDSIIFPDVDIGEKSQIRRTIIDRGVKIAPGEKIGFNPEEDKKRFFVSQFQYRGHQPAAEKSFRIGPAADFVRRWG